MSIFIKGKGKYNENGMLILSEKNILNRYYSGQKVTIDELKTVNPDLLLMLNKKKSTKELFNKLGI